VKTVNPAEGGHYVRKSLGPYRILTLLCNCDLHLNPADPPFIPADAAPKDLKLKAPESFHSFTFSVLRFKFSFHPPLAHLLQHIQYRSENALSKRLALTRSAERRSNESR
jgi:hypothetical protein